MRLPDRFISGRAGFKTMMLLSAVCLLIFVPPVASGDQSKQKSRVSSARQKDPCKLERSKQAKEEELRIALRTIRRAIDDYKNFCELGLVSPRDRRPNDECYPPNLEVLLKGVIPPNKKTPYRFLRRIPVDPMTGKASWGLRSMQDEPDATTWGEQNVFDVYSKSDGVGLDGIRYRDW